MARLASGQCEFEFDRSWKGLPPWGIAAVARESILCGSEMRSKPVDQRALRRIFNLFNQANGGIPEGKHLWLMIQAFLYEQFSYQDSPLHDIARTFLLLVDLEVEDPRFPAHRDWREVLGMTLEERMQVVFAISVYVKENAGLLDPSAPERDRWQDLPFSPALRLDSVATAISDLTTTIDQARSDYEAVPRVAEHLHRFGYSPLTKKPLVDLNTGLLVAPQWLLILRTMTIENLYYAACAKWGNNFAEELGVRVEAYTGMQLRYAGFQDVLPEISYGKGKKLSVDWFVVTEEIVLLFECKSAKIPLAARAGGISMENLLKTAIGKAREQIKKSSGLVREGHSEFSAIPSGLSQIGIIVTAEPIYSANDYLFNEELPDPGIPCLTISLKELELLTALGSQMMVQVLSKIVNREHFAVWSVHNAIVDALGHQGLPANKIVVDAFDEFVIPRVCPSSRISGCSDSD
ncbi:hypothetical protein GCM10023081_24550 [Arthrobacter ginkgonis]|uniref:Restriction endonuclease n=1 Tax=Arthrobacter ginkgonis TaxID=1630594 RepID=A0ABP7CEC0_9MICC